MKIGINGLIIDKKKAGIGQYGYNLINALIKYSQIDYTLFLQKNIQFDYNSIIYRNSYKKSIYRVWDEQTSIVSKYKDLDLIHFLDYSSPIVNINKPFIITIHDLCFYKYPETFTFGSRKLKNIIAPISIKNARKIITVSENTKKDLIEYFPYAKDKIEVIYSGPPEVEKIFCKDKISQVKNKYGIKGQYILSVGTLEPRKNLKRLIEAYNIISRQIKDVNLVIVGKNGWLCGEIFEAINRENLKNKILSIGYVEQNDMSALYSGAELFIYPSIYEGFGFPPLEAMICGIPVVVSNTSSLPEVVGEAGVYVDPFDIESIANGMMKGLEDTELRNKLIKLGAEQVKKFNWKDTSKKVVEVYREILS